ncbi:unnamed protein product, partial [Strongylus vulgaris]
MSKIEELSVIRVSSAIEGTIGSRVWMVSWNHSGTLLASCGDDKTVRIWKKTSKCNKLEGHESEVKCCAFSPSDEFLATCSRDKSVWFWQMDEDDDFQVCSVLQQHTQDVKFVKWHPSEELLVSCSYDYSLVFYKFDGEDWITQQKIPDAHDGTVWCAAFDSEGHRLITVGEDSIVQLWKRNSLSEPAVNDKWRSVAKLHVDSQLPLYSVSCHNVTGLIAVAGGDGFI